ncbi:MAG: ferritin [Candidatus Amulumruptor caecigallinarius]|nr:ferritin [Candidatus Amulumruptor caecigallinarius]
MKINEKLAKAINDQINAEFWSAYLYLSMSIYWRENGRPGVANWFKVQFQEEQAHAEIFIEYLQNRDGKVRLEPITGVKQTWTDLAETFADTLAHECLVTEKINALYQLAEEERDYATRQMLNWYIAEQVEEEANVRNIIDSLNLVGDNGTGIMQIDRELATRSYTAPKVN